MRPFLASLFLRGLFCLARFGVFRPISALRAAYGGCAPKRACGRSAMGDQRRCLWNPSPDGATPLRVLRTWAAPNMGYAQSFEKGGPKLYTLCYAVVIVGPAWSLSGVLSEAQNRLPQPGKGRYCLPHTLCYAVVIVGPAWSPDGVLSEAQNRLPQPGKGCYSLPPSTASDSRHNPSPGTTLRRGAPGRVRGRVGGLLDRIVLGIIGPGK